MDNFLVDQLMEQMHKGKKIWGVFTKTAYTIVAREIGENFELGCNSEHIKNRMKPLKKKTFMLLKKFYKVVVDLVSMNQLKWSKLQRKYGLLTLRWVDYYFWVIRNKNFAHNVEI